MAPHGGLTFWGCWRVRCETGTLHCACRDVKHNHRNRRYFRGEGSIWYQCKYCLWKDKPSTTAQGNQLQTLTQMGRMLRWDPGLKHGPRGIPFLRCPGGRSAPFLPCPPTADLNTQAAAIGCGAWEARNPRPLWGAHVENTGSGSHGVQGQRPQIRPGLTQVLRLMGKSPQWVSWA